MRFELASAFWVSPAFPSRVLATSFGYAITKADIFPAAAARGAGQIALVSKYITKKEARVLILLSSNIRILLYHVLCSPRSFRPSLLKTRLRSVCRRDLIPTEDSILAGPLVLVAVIYQAFGVIFAWIVKQIFWVPHRFRYGIIVAGGFGNVGDIREQTVFPALNAP
jgi:auxin efflux carrier family protein